MSDDRNWGGPRKKVRPDDKRGGDRGGPKLGRKPKSATIKTGDGVFLSEVGVGPIGKGIARIDRADSGARYIAIVAEDGTEYRLVIVQA